jgi:hypothetical protein
MAKYDKYEPLAGGFRARLNAALTLVSGEFGPKAVSLNASGLAVVGTAGQSGLVGILVKNVAKGPIGSWTTSLNGGTPNAYAPIGAQAGDVVDIMTNGDIVDLDEDDYPAGTLFFAQADGDIVAQADATAGDIPIGFTVEAGRLIVRIATGAAGDATADAVAATALTAVPGSFADLAAVRTYLNTVIGEIKSSPYFS